MTQHSAMTMQASNNPRAHAVAVAMGFTDVDMTGGNCLAYHRSLPGGAYAWLTDEDGCSLPSDADLDGGEDSCLGFYKADGDCTGLHYGPLAEMPAIIGAMVEAAVAR